MTKREELQQEITKRTARIESLVGDLTKADEVKKETDELRTIVQQAKAMDQAVADEAETRAALAKVPVPEQPGIVPSTGWGEVRKSLLAMARGERRAGSIALGAPELRAITANGAGVNTAPGIVRALVDGGKLRSKVRVFPGKNAQTVVDVFAPHMAVPVGTAEGATGTSSDSTAVLAGQALVLKPWYSTLAISMAALMSTDIESELPAIFAEAFGQAIDKAICVGAGSGSDALGVFIASSSGVTTSQDIACAAAGTPKWTDLAKMALTLLGAMNGPLDQLAILMHPNIVAPLLVEANTDPFKIEYLTKGTILGIPVILTSYGLTTLTAGSYVAVGGYFGHYALAIAQEIMVDQIKTVGSDNITFQALMYMQGKPLVATSFARLKTV